MTSRVVTVIQDDDVIIESSSSGPGTPLMAPVSNPETPRSLTAAAEAAAVDSHTGTPPPPPSATRIAAATGSMVAPPPLGGLPAGNGPPASKYSQLLTVIEEMGRDIRPTYAGGKTSAERLKRSIMHARILVRECLMECDRAARS